MCLCVPSYTHTASNKRPSLKTVLEYTIWSTQPWMCVCIKWLCAITHTLLVTKGHHSKLLKFYDMGVLAIKERVCVCFKCVCVCVYELSVFVCVCVTADRQARTYLPGVCLHNRQPSQIRHEYPENTDTRQPSQIRHEHPENTDTRQWAVAMRGVSQTDP